MINDRQATDADALYHINISIYHLKQQTTQKLQKYNIINSKEQKLRITLKHQVDTKIILVDM